MFATDTTINYFSNHPIELKTAACRYFITCMHLCPFSSIRKERKKMAFHTTCSQGQKYLICTYPKTKSQIQLKMSNPIQHNNTLYNSQKWASFTYYSPFVWKITNLFKQTNVSIASHTTNILCILLKPRKHNTIIEFTENGIYEMSWSTCKFCYVG